LKLAFSGRLKAVFEQSAEVPVSGVRATGGGFLFFSDRKES